MIQTSSLRAITDLEACIVPSGPFIVSVESDYAKRRVIMRSIVKSGTFIYMAIAMSACATKHRDFNRIDANARQYIQKIDSVLITNQDTIEADINVSNLSSVMQGNLVLGMIDAGFNTHRSNEAEKIMAPIYKTLYDYNYAEEVQKQFNQALSESKIEEASGLQILNNEPRGFRYAYIKQSKADAVMFVDIGYAFSPNFDALNLTSDVVIYPVINSLNPFKEKPDYDNRIEHGDNIYRNQFLASIMPTGMNGSKEENGARWTQMSEEELSGRMQRGAKKLAEFIANDLSLDDENAAINLNTADPEPETESTVLSESEPDTSETEPDT